MPFRTPLAAKFLIHQLLYGFGKKTFHFPWAIYLYLTFRCNLRCSYCDDGSGRKFPEMEARELDLAQWEKILRSLIPFSDVLLLSGGEPLLYPPFEAFVRMARKIGFRFVSLNTNGILLTEKIMDLVDALIISLDSLDRGRSDRIWSREGATEKVLEVVEIAAKRRHPSLMVNTVILPETLDEVTKVLEFCERRNIAFSCSPALDQTRPVPGLRENPKYKVFVNRLLAAKRRGQKIAATVDYIRSVSTFRSYDCHPLLVWRIHPDGTLVYPCSRKNVGIGSLLTHPDPIDLFKSAAGGHFFTMNCPDSCQLSCYMDTSYMIQRPLGLLREGFYRLKTFSQGHRLVY